MKYTTALLCLLVFLKLSTLPSSATQTISLHNALLAGMTEISVIELGLTPGEITSYFAAYLREEPSLFHVSPTFGYRYNTQGIVISLCPTYTLQGESLLAARQLYEDTLTHIENNICPSWSDAEKALYIHDFLAFQYTYDLQEINRDAYTLFRDGRGVCQAYALTFSAIARRVGLSADMVYSNTMNHAWNHVLVDGEWYHVDVTRDDPVDGNSTTVLHQRLLRSDEGMVALGYRDYTCSGGHSCPSTRFERQDHQSFFFAWETVAHHREHCWYFSSSDGDIIPVTFSPHPTAYRAGDLSLDGKLTPHDLLLLHDLTDHISCSEETFTRLRENILLEIDT